MRIRIFRAPSLASAMGQIRRELGPEALILSERTRDGFIEVTAALDTVQIAALRAPATVTLEPSRALPVVDDLEPFNPSVQPNSEPLRRAMAWHGVPPGLMEALLQGSLEQACARLFRFQPLDLSGHTSPLFLAGPPGAGKTLSVARLATRLVLDGHRPLVITADAQRAGAVEQLAAFTRLLGLTIVAAGSPELLARALTRRTAGQAVLIDAPGLDLEDAAQSDLLQSLLAASDSRLVLVLPCGLDSNEAQEIAGGHARLGAASMIATRTDVSRRLGAILAAANGNNLAFSEVGIASSAADGLVPMTAAFLSERLQRAGPPPPLSPLPDDARSSSGTPPAAYPPTRSALPMHMAAQQASIAARGNQLVRPG